MTTAMPLYVVVPDDIHDPLRPSGGNTYDRQICIGLAAIGWSVQECAVPGPWPSPGTAAIAGLTSVLAGIEDGAVVLVDGLIASTVPQVLVPEADRLRLVVLLHMPLGDSPHSGNQERAVMSAAAAIITTSSWTRHWLLDRYALRPDRVHVARPGVDPAELATGTATGGELLCVAAVTPNKGHDILLAALAELAEASAASHLAWRCVCVGDLNRDPDFVASLNQQARAGRIGDRLVFTGPQTGADLDAAYAAADVLVLASRAETYAMVVTEALARGLPVVATSVGGLPEALGRVADGTQPGLLVPPGDPGAFAAALRCWLGDAGLRQRLRHAAAERRSATLSGWPVTADRISHVLAQVAALPEAAARG